MIFAFTPTYLALYISFTRVTDYWHHYDDVIFGILIGVAVAFVAEYLYLYPLLKKWKLSCQLTESANGESQVQFQEIAVQTESAMQQSRKQKNVKLCADV